MWWWVIIALVVLVLLALCIPLDLIVHVNTNESPACRLRLLWLFGIVDQDLKKHREKTAKKEKPAKAKGTKRRHGITPATICQVLKTRGISSQLKRLVLGIYRSLRIKELAAHLKLGLENPADTALLFAITGPLNFFFSLLPYKITIAPTFDSDLALEASIHGIARLWPVLLLFAVAQFIFSVPALHIARIVIRARWKKAQ